MVLAERPGRGTKSRLKRGTQNDVGVQSKMWGVLWAAGQKALQYNSNERRGRGTLLIYVYLLQYLFFSGLFLRL